MADFHKGGIYVSGRLWAKARLVVRLLDVVSVARLLWSSWCVLGAVDFFVFFFVFSMSLHARIQDRWLRETQSSQRRLGEGATADSQSAHRELVPTHPHQVYHLLLSLIHI